MYSCRLRNRLSMKLIVVRRPLGVVLKLAVIFLLFQCIQGALHHFNSKRHHKTEYRFKKYHTLSSNGAAADDEVSPQELVRARDRRQTLGGNPQAYTFNLYGDTRSFAQTFYSGEGSKVLFVLTYDTQKESSRYRVTSSELYRSTDYGQTFHSQSSKLQSGFQLHNTIYKFPNSRTLIFADTSKSMIYVTTNEGETFSSRYIPVNPRTLKVHPSLSGWILGHDPFQGVLMYSRDSGTSWATVARNVHPSGSSEYTIHDFNWGVPGIDWDINNPSQSDISKVFYSVIDPNLVLSSNNSKTLYVANNPGRGYVNKLFEPNLRYFYDFLMDGDFIFASQAVSSANQYQLYVSHKRKPFSLTRFPTTVSHYQYFITSHRSSQVLVIIEHENIYNLYLSDEAGIYYSLSLEDIVVEVNDIQLQDFTVDLRIIDSINGTMIANQFTFDSGRKRNQTLITFSNGAQWKRIAAPTYVDGEPTYCHLPTCSLHFHMGSSEDYSQLGVYSSNSAPGIIIAHGNSGPHLSDSGSVYVTRDGGLTWEKTLDSTWHVEIIDHGGLLVAAKDNHQDYSMTIRYSCNEGMTWSDFAFANSRIVVWGIVTEPGETTTQVLLYSTNSRTSRSNWIITHINFTSIFPYTCQALDYYNWIVSDGRTGNQRCLLGETRIIERRRPDVCCWNSRQYERVISTTPCQCTEADFECDWGYRRDRNSGNCTILDPKCGTESDCLTGYRKIAGDVCFGGVSSQYLSPRDCVSDADSRCGGMTAGSNGGDNNSTSDSTTDIDSTSGDDNNSSIIIIVVSVAVLLISLVSLIILNICCIRKWKKICCADKPVVMQKAHEGNPEPTKIRFSYVRIFITNLRQQSKLYSNEYY